MNRWPKPSTNGGAPSKSSNKAAPTWEELDESRKESSRDQARDIGAKLDSIGCAIAPLRDWDAKGFRVHDEEVESSPSTNTTAGGGNESRTAGSWRPTRTLTAKRPRISCHGPSC